MTKSNKLNAEHLAQLCDAMVVLQSSEEASKFLLDLCSPMELQAMIDRWRVVEPLKQSVPYRKIYSDTGVSATTVGRVARVINMGEGGYDMVYQRLKST